MDLKEIEFHFIEKEMKFKKKKQKQKQRGFVLNKTNK